jgi:hypothetical protein
LDCPTKTFTGRKEEGGTQQEEPRIFKEPTIAAFSIA